MVMDGCSFLRLGLGFVWVEDSVIVAFGLGECGSNGMRKIIAVDLGGTKG